MPAYLLIAATAWVAAAQPSAGPPARTAQQPGSDEVRARHEVCYALAAGPSYPALDLAGCLSFDRAAEAAFWTEVCSFLRDSEQLQDYALASYSDCIRQRLIR